MFSSLPKVSTSFISSSGFVTTKQRKNGMVKREPKYCPLTTNERTRRSIIELLGFSSIAFYVFPVLAAPSLDMKEPEVLGTLKLARGVRIQEIIEEEGPEGHEGDLVEVNYVCQRGYFVHSTVDQFSGESTPVILPLDENKIINGLKKVLTGMKVGGKRRALIPPSVG